MSWFKMSRCVFDSDLWHDVSTFRLFMLLIGKATPFDGKRVAGEVLRKGQYLRSYEKLREDLAYKMGRGKKEYSKKTIHNCLQKLIKAGRITVRETDQGTVFTVVNYVKYQEFGGIAEGTGNGTAEKLHERDKQTQKDNKHLKHLEHLSIKHKDRRKRVYDVSSLHYKLAQHFYEQIKRNNPEHLEPDMQKWADDIRKMMEIDKRSEEQIRDLIEWAQQDDFEMAVVLSPSKLRKRFDALAIKVRQQKRQPATVETIAATKYEYDYGF
ncbi:hypothetical protein QR721_08725 [Aciduricibacillus chroicocephali]|uniref:Replication protein n=1 Tax=Aciduricibacillus chroicocephali TaxID=3054939 RepID=A0ABY9KSI5_9BACI|nr:hypothetical protein QR721_08725 [Bacillaceae bacterium 44XB]